VYRREVLEWAYARCRANDGAAGVDDQTFVDIEAYGLDRWLDELAEDLRKRTYCPQPGLRRTLHDSPRSAARSGRLRLRGPGSMDAKGVGRGQLPGCFGRLVE
jgi:hypothetical protein